MRDFSLLFLTRVGCHLCDEVRPVAHEVAQRSGLVLSELDIDTDSGLRAQYTERIPVLTTSDGTVLAEGADFNSRRIRKTLKRL